MGEITFLLGGARSGKSSYAVDLAKNCQGRVVYLATGISCDEEMERRFEKHKSDRPDSWETIEEPLHVGSVLKNLSESADLALLDCLGFLVTNLILHYQDQGKDDSQVENAVLEHIIDIASTARDAELDVIVVSNEVGMGIVPDTSLGRLFRDILGRANQMIAANADEVLFFVAGLPMKVK
ncbi:bifunctional adenosylcobinamide kinase/adenosylcobinamide-phosphate guanylyltransferase [Candidatus Poribacteria bacterium]